MNRHLHVQQETSTPFDKTLRLNLSVNPENKRALEFSTASLSDQI